MTKLKVGVIGVGGIAQDRHIPALLKLKDTVSLVAVQDINTVQMIDVVVIVWSFNAIPSFLLKPIPLPIKITS